MNKLLTKVARLALGLSLAAGVGVAIGSKAAERVDAATANISSFSSTSGNLDTNISYTSAQGDGTTAPAVSSNQLRIYKPASGKSTGGLITVSAADGYVMTSCIFSIANDKNGTIKSQIDNGSLSSNISVTKANDTSNLISGTASSVTIYNVGSDRLGIGGISVVYQTSSTPTFTITYDSNVGESGDVVTNMPSNTSATQGSTFTLDSTNIPERAGYVFNGWAASSNSSTAISEIANVQSNQTVYAIWTIDTSVTVTFVGGTDVGSTSSNGSSDEVTKNGITMSGTDAAFATSEYRFYASSSITISTSLGNIVYIEFTGGDSSKPVSNISGSGYSNGVWTGESTSVTFSVGSQARSQSVIVKYEPFAVEEATTLTISPSSATVYAGEQVTFTPTLSGGVGDYEKTISWATTNSSVVVAPSNSEDGVAVTVTTLASGSVTLTGTVVSPGSASGSITITVNAQRTLSSVTSTGQTIAFNAGDKFSYGGTLTANYSNSTSATVTPTSFKIGESGINPTSAGTVINNDTILTVADYNGKTIYVLYTEGGVTQYDSYTISVTRVETITFTAGTDLGSTDSNGSPDEMYKSGITISCTDAAFATAEYRFYKNSTATISSSVGNIKSIDFTCTNGKPASGFALQAGWAVSGDNGCWTGNASSVEFSASTEQVRSTMIVVKLVPITPAVELSTNSVDLKTNQTDGVQVTATVYNVASPTYSWVANNQNVTLVGANTNQVTIKPNIETAGSATVTLTVGGASPALDPVSVAVSISVPGPGETEGTAFTVAQAISHIDAVISGGEHADGNDGNYYYVTGIVSRLYGATPAVTANGEISYYISDDGTTTNDFEIFKGKSFAGANFTSIDEIQVGDEVVVYGQIKLYSTTYEFESHGELVSLNRPVDETKVTGVTLDLSEVTIDITGVKTRTLVATVSPDTALDKSVSWSSSDPEVATVADGVVTALAAGTTTITVTTTDGSFTASCSVTVVDPNAPVAPEGTSITYDSSEQGFANQADVTSATILDGCITASFSSGSKYYTTGTAIRVYSGKTFTITSTKANLVSISLTFGSGDGSNAISADSGTYSNGTWTADGTSYPSSVEFTIGGSSGHRRIKAISVHYYGSEEFAYDFLTHTGCTADGSVAPTITWSTYSSRFSILFSADQTVLTGATANESGTNIQKAVARYDYIVGKYGISSYSNFMSRTVTPIGGAKLVIATIGENANTIAIIVIISMVSVTAIGGYFFIKRRKVN